MTSENITDLMGEYARAVAKEREYREALERIVFDLPEKEAHIAAQAAMDGAYERLKDAVADIVGVQSTDYGKCGYQLRRTLTYKPESIRAHCPDMASLLIHEAVDAKAIKAIIPAAIKSGKAPTDLLEKLEAEAEVKETKAFILQLQEKEG